MRRFVFIVALAGCSHGGSIQHQMPLVDMSPLGCGYKWIQSGHAAIDCDQADAMPIKQKTLMATDDAWRIARERCPSTCPPRELRDTSAGPERPGSNDCHSGTIYFQKRVFFQCSSPGS